jgi:GDP-L-fucose synthase
MELKDKIYVAGHTGLVGSSIIRLLHSKGFNEIVTRTHKELDLTNQAEVEVFFKIEKPKYVILAAAKVGGIQANNMYPADFIYDNIMIQTNVVSSSYKVGVKRLIFLGSTCVYPKNVKQPMKEEALLTNLLEPTNEPYSIAKISGIKLCESFNRQYETDFRSLMPTNLYGVNDNFHLENSHVVPALMRKIHLAKCLENFDWHSIKADLKKNPIKSITESSLKVEIIQGLAEFGINFNEENSKSSIDVWGSGRVMREFLCVDDMAAATLFILGLGKKTYLLNTKPMISHINIGTGVEISIKELANIMKKIINFKGDIRFDISKPEGPARKLIETSRLEKMGWTYDIELEEGLKNTYEWYLNSN